VAPDGSTDYVAVMQFKPTASTANLKQVPKRLIDPSAASASSAVHRRQFVLDSGLCASRPQASPHAEMPALIGINGKPFDPERIDVETKAWNNRNLGNYLNRNGASVSCPRCTVSYLVDRGSAAAGSSHQLEGHRSRRGQSRASRSLQSASNPGAPLHVSLSHP
jgi:hypothetical protein